MKDLLDFAILTAIYLIFFYKKWRKKGNDVLLVNTTMYIYLSFVLYFTLMPIICALPFIFDHPYVPMNLTPFIDITYNRVDSMRQIILNIIMTIPFGFLLPLTNCKNCHHNLNSYKNLNHNPAAGHNDRNHHNFRSTFLGLLRVLLFTFLLSFTIETLQPLLHSFRSSDITDLITNIIGGLIGYLLYLVFKPLVLKILDLIKTPADKTE